MSSSSSSASLHRGPDSVSSCDNATGAGRLGTAIRLPFPLPGEPAPTDDKYSGGVVGICAGSSQYPGAGILATTAAVRTSSSMVRWIGGDPLPVVLTNPEVVVHPDVASSGRVQAWVVGPGRGTGSVAAGELDALLSRSEPLLLDADALNLVSADQALLSRLAERSALTVLTPHAGEFARLSAAVADHPGLPAPSAQLFSSRRLTQHSLVHATDGERAEQCKALAGALHCTVLLKGRVTVVADGTEMLAARLFDAGSSWAATAGAGDVLAGIVGALLAQGRDAVEACLVALQIHAVAASTSAETPAGPAPTSASRIAAAIPEAIAALSAR